MVHDRDVVGDAPDQRHVVFDDQDRDCELRHDQFEQPGQALDVFRREPGRGLVEQQDPRAGRQRPRHLKQALLAIRQAVCRAVRDLRQADKFEQVADAETGRGLPVGDAHIVANAEAAEQLRSLKRAGDAAARNGRRVEARKRAAIEPDLARRTALKAGDAIDDRAFTGPVRPDQGMDLARDERHGRVGHGGKAAEADRHILKFKQRAHVALPRRGSKLAIPPGNTRKTASRQMP